jgi:AcrR family transcriptional regulator
VPRTTNEQRPGELLDAIIGYLEKRGVADLSLRPLAKAIGSSPRVLLYYFGSKEAMVDKALARLRGRQRALYGPASYRAIWRHMSTPASEPYFRLFFEVYGIALRQPERFRDFLRTTIEDWLDLQVDLLLREGWERKRARAFATVVLAGFRGFMLDYCASHNRQRLDSAVSLWLAALDEIGPAKKGRSRK